MKRRILIFTVDYFPYVGGAEVAVREIAARIPEAAFTLITSRNSRALPREAYFDRIRVIRVGLGMRSLDKYIFPFLACVRARALHIQEPFSCAWAIMAFAGIPAYFFRMIGRVPYILSLQEGDSDAYYLRRTWWWLPLYRAIHARAHSVHAISAALAARARRFGYAGAVALIPNGVDPAFFFPAASLPAAPPYRIITISRLVPKNGVQDLIRALNIMRAVHRLPATLMIIGAGFEERKLRALARALGVAEYVSFAGAIPHEQIPSRLRGAHAFARLSHSEGLGNAFLEAMACGVPVAGTPVGGIPDFLRDGENGILCPVRNPAAAAARIARALTDSAYADRIRAGGLKTARAHAWGNIAPRMRLLFDSVHL